MELPVVIGPGGGEVVGDSAERRVEILCDDDAVHATWSRFAPGREGADLHVHRRHSDLFYVLEGELTVRLGVEDRQAVVPAGTLARVPPLVVHGFRNASDAELRYLNLHAPGRRFADFLRALRDGRDFAYDQEAPPADGGRPASEAVIGGERVVVDRPGLRLALLAEAPEIVVAEVTIDRGELPAPPASRFAALAVLDGELAVRAGDRELAAPAGSWVRLPPGVPAADCCRATGPARCLAVHAPASL